MTTGKKSVVAAVLAVVVLSTIGYALMVRDRNLVEVEAGVVVRQDLVRLVTANGEITPKRYVNLSSNTFGPIVSLAVAEGDLVEEGQFLLQVESVSTEADLRSAQASLDAARAELEGMSAATRSAQASLVSAEADRARAQADLAQARAESQRAEELFNEGLISREEFERQQSTRAVSQTQLDAAEARVAQVDAQLAQVQRQSEGTQLRIGQQEAALVRARDALDKTTIVAPLSGVITYLPVNEGENAIVGVQNQPGTTLMTIADMSVITAEVRVDETDIVNVQLGQHAEVRVDALGDRILTGEVSEIGNSALTASGAPASTTTTNTNANEARDFKVVVTLDDPPSELRPGLSATANIETAYREAVLTIPIQALTVREIDPSEGPPFIEDPTLIERPGQDSIVEQEGVFVLEDRVAMFRPVLTGIVGTAEIEIIDGLDEGDRIVTGSYRVLRSLEDETRVRIAETNQ